MSAPGPQAPDDRPRQEPIEPAQMTAAEKFLCEWEARHDVAARGRIADVAAVQHYLTHVRCDDDLHRPATHGPRAADTPRPTAGRGTAVPPGLRQWMRWGEEGRPGAPVIPRG